MIGSIIRGMVIDMNETRLCSLEQLQAFLGATVQVHFSPSEGEDAREISGIDPGEALRLSYSETFFCRAS